MNIVITVCPSRRTFFVQPLAAAGRQARLPGHAHWLTNGYEPLRLVGFAGSDEEALERLATHRADEVRCGRTPLPVAVILYHHDLAARADGRGSAMNLVITFCPARRRYFVQPPADAERRARNRWHAHWLTNGYEPLRLVGFASSPEEALERIKTHRVDEARCGRTPLPMALIELQLFEVEGARHAAI